MVIHFTSSIKKILNARDVFKCVTCRYFIYVISLAIILFISCNNNPKHLFSLLSSNKTGIHFKNILKENETANVLTTLISITAVALQLVI